MDVGFVEHVFASPVRGNLSATNLPLRQSFAFPFTGGAKNAPVTPGIPQAMLDFLNSAEGKQAANCRAADVIRSMRPVGQNPRAAPCRWVSC